MRSILIPLSLPIFLMLAALLIVSRSADKQPVHIYVVDHPECSLPYGGSDAQCVRNAIISAR